MPKVATLRTGDKTGRNRIIELFRSEGYAVDIVSRSMFNLRTIVAFDGCYQKQSSGAGGDEIITVEDVREYYRPPTDSDDDPWDADRSPWQKKLDSPVTIEFIDQEAKETIVERVLDEGYSLDPLEEHGHGHAKFNMFTESWSPSEDETVTVADVPEQYQANEPLGEKPPVES